MPHTNQQDKEGIQQPSLVPKLELPKSGGAIKGVGEKYTANPVTGTGNMSFPIAVTAARGAPQLSLSYSSGAGNSAFGLGWDLSVPQISRKTERQLPLYNDNQDSDIFILSGAEDLVKKLNENGSDWEVETFVESYQIDDEDAEDYDVTRYRPRTEGLFSRIEKLTNQGTGVSFWRSISGENITSIYGETEESRVADPDEPKRVFNWLLCKTFDNKGNLTLFDYKRENDDDVSDSLSEHKRKQNDQPQRYLKCIRYGNRTMYKKGMLLEADNFLFKVILNYGEHTDPINPAETLSTWVCRDDSFSSYRSGFEVRTRRLCQQVLMFHCFPDGQDPDYPDFGLGKDRLIQSTDFEYDHNAIASQLSSITSIAYEKEGGAYIKNPMPPVEFTYSKAVLDDRQQSISEDNSRNMPQGLSGDYQFTDINAEGLSGVLYETSGAWYYKRNLGEGQFENLKVIADRPSWSRLNGGTQLANIEANGQLYLSRNGTDGGYSKRADDGTWSPFKPYEQTPNVDLSNPDIRYLDLTGDGKPEMVILRDRLLRWHPNLGEKGYEEERRNFTGDDEEQGPAHIFRNDLESIFMTDMTGDGLSDIVRIRNGEVSYWPNLGYGNFGQKVIMDDAPHFDAPDVFDPKNIRIGDIDGSGTTDILYLGAQTTQYWHNQAGNSFSAPKVITSFPRNHNQSVVSLVDLLGNGTACLVWSSPLESDLPSPCRYIDIMGSTKPYLLTEIRNNMGSVTTCHYKPSTYFYLKDERDGNPWVTKLPFPVHVLHTSEIEDLITGRRFVTEYAYHHGYYDRAEREFRGFGFVEQWDDEEFEFEDPLKDPTDDNPENLYRKPRIHTKSWFHTGAWEKETDLSDQYQREYWNPQNLEEPSALLEPSELLESADWRFTEIREAKRALRGQLLRSEVYADDGDPDIANKPYTVTESRYQVKQLQPQKTSQDRDNKHAVFISLPAETLTAHYERNADDPRISHEVTVEIDDYGNVLKSAAIAYPRQISWDSDNPKEGETLEQFELKIVYTENQVFNQTDSEAAWFAKGLPVSAKVYEVNNLGITPDPFFRRDELLQKLPAASKRLLSAQVSYYRTDASANFLSPDQLGLGVVEPYMLPYGTYQLIYNDRILAEVEDDTVDRVTWIEKVEGEGYQHETHAEEAGWWVSGGFSQYDPDHFFISTEAIDPWGNRTKIKYDSIDLLPIKITDPLLNEVKATYGYRILQPLEITDPNGNRQQVAYDGFGRVIRTAVKGKEGEAMAVGDELGSNPRDAHTVHDTETTVIEYDHLAFTENRGPNYVHTYSRETHHHDLDGTDDSRWMEARVYSDGFGQELQSFAKVEPGDIRNLDGSMEPPTPERWLASGRTVFDNKGQPVKQFEPYFCATSDYKEEEHLIERGVSVFIHYDPLGRVIRTDMPDGTFTKVEFNPWMQKTYDANDTVLDSAWLQDMQSGSSAGQRAAQLSSVHDDTPTITVFDVLGRPVKTTVQNKDDINGLDESYTSTVELDIVGNELKVIDSNGNTASLVVYDMAGRPMKSISNDAGTTHALMTIDNRPAMAWQPRRHEVRMEYDGFRRPLYLWLREPGATEEIIKEATVYGEQFSATPETHNMRGQVWKSYDQAGIAEVNAYDFKGAPLQSTRRIVDDYLEQGNWTGLDDGSNLPEANEAFTSSIAYDALGRPTQSTAPDGSITANEYDLSGALQKVKTKLIGDTDFKEQVQEITYNEKGQRESITYGNRSKTSYDYDPLSYRLTHLSTRRNTHTSNELIQDLYYTYDANGNIVEIEDKAQQTIYFRNSKVEPKQQFVYDGLNRLVQATGREHIGQQASGEQITAPDAKSGGLPYPILETPAGSDLNALERYTQTYRYDGAGNIQEWHHRKHTTNNGYTRYYSYDYSDLADSNQHAGYVSENNHLLSTTVNRQTTPYDYDAAGNIEKLSNHESPIQWNFENQPVYMDFGESRKAYYQYDASGERVRKVVVKDGFIEERLYLGGYELYRKNRNGGIEKKRETLHVADDAGRICIIETLTEQPSGETESTAPVCRYQLSNHLGSVGIELDENAEIISYEEYHPYGTTAFHWKSNSISQKRYRYTGKERDEESGLSYHSARYYMPWLGRWLSADPAGMVDGPCLYQYSLSNPVMLMDENGMQTNCDDTIVINEGETIEGIARRMLGDEAQYSEVVSLRDNILIQNGIKDARSVQIGQELFVPLSNATQESGISSGRGIRAHKLFENHMKEIHRLNPNWVFEGSDEVLGIGFKPDAVYYAADKVFVWDLKNFVHQKNETVPRLNTEIQLDGYQFLLGRKSEETRRIYRGVGPNEWSESDKGPVPFSEPFTITEKEGSTTHVYRYFLGQEDLGNGPSKGIIFYFHTAIEDPDPIDEPVIQVDPKFETEDRKKPQHTTTLMPEKSLIVKGATILGIIAISLLAVVFG